MKDYSKEVLEAVKRLPQYIKLLYKIFKSSELKKSHRLLLYGAIGYVVSPIDLIPGVIPVIGQLDDILVVLTVIYKVISSYRKDKFADLLGECNLSIDIVKNDVEVIKRYTKLLGISTAKIAAHGIKTLGVKSLNAIRKGLQN
ncbi:MAG: DUF1232 domain-containing protein [Firmicutes bacterium]|nr:DUF1232 domain-containing protein [Bacillota bacterium]